MSWISLFLDAKFCAINGTTLAITGTRLSPSIGAI